MTYFPRSKGAKQKLVGLQAEAIPTVTLACGPRGEPRPVDLEP